MTTTQDQKASTFNLQSLGAVPSHELLSRLLAAALDKLGGSMTVAEDDLYALDGRKLEHGQRADGTFVVRLSAR